MTERKHWMSLGLREHLFGERHEKVLYLHKPGENRPDGLTRPGRFYELNCIEPLCHDRRHPSIQQAVRGVEGL